MNSKDEWGTPKKLFDLLNREFGFTVDAAADSLSTKCTKFWSKIDDGLKQNWKNERVFVNPPYSKRQIVQWVMKAFAERNYAEVIVMLIPVRTDRKYFHDYIADHAEIRFIKGRVHFTPLAGQNRGCPSFPSMIVIWKRNVRPMNGIRSLGEFAIKDVMER